MKRKTRKKAIFTASAAIVTTAPIIATVAQECTTGGENTPPIPSTPILPSDPTNPTTADTVRTSFQQLNNFKASDNITDSNVINLLAGLTLHFVNTGIINSIAFTSEDVTVSDDSSPFTISITGNVDVEIQQTGTGNLLSYTGSTVTVAGINAQDNIINTPLSAYTVTGLTSDTANINFVKSVVNSVSDFSGNYPDSNAANFINGVLNWMDNQTASPFTYTEIRELYFTEGQVEVTSDNSSGMTIYAVIISGGVNTRATNSLNNNQVRYVSTQDVTISGIMIDENGNIVDLGNDTGYDVTGLVIESSNVEVIRLAIERFSVGYNATDRMLLSQPAEQILIAMEMAAGSGAGQTSSIDPFANTANYLLITSNQEGTIWSARIGQATAGTNNRFSVTFPDTNGSSNPQTWTNTMSNAIVISGITFAADGQFLNVDNSMVANFARSA